MSKKGNQNAHINDLAIAANHIKKKREPPRDLQKLTTPIDGIYFNKKSGALFKCEIWSAEQEVKKRKKRLIRYQPLHWNKETNESTLAMKKNGEPKFRNRRVDVSDDSHVKIYEYSEELMQTLTGESENLKKTYKRPEPKQKKSRSQSAPAESAEPKGTPKAPADASDKETAAATQQEGGVTGENGKKPSPQELYDRIKKWKEEDNPFLLTEG